MPAGIVSVTETRRFTKTDKKVPKTVARFIASRTHQQQRTQLSTPLNGEATCSLWSAAAI